mgnify:CR=1 FL=1
MAEQVKTRRQLQGVVVSDKMDKTITVEVRTYKTHPIYGKRVQYRKKYKANVKKLKSVIQLSLKKQDTYQLLSISA